LSLPQCTTEGKIALLFRAVKNNGKHGMRFYKGHNSWAWGIHNTAFDNILNQVAG
jgi:hypothetical protein